MFGECYGKCCIDEKSGDDDGGELVVVVEVYDVDYVDDFDQCWYDGEQVDIEQEVDVGCVVGDVVSDVVYFLVGMKMVVELMQVGKYIEQKI